MALFACLSQVLGHLQFTTVSADFQGLCVWPCFLLKLVYLPSPEKYAQTHCPLNKAGSLLATYFWPCLFFCLESTLPSLSSVPVKSLFFPDSTKQAWPLHFLWIPTISSVQLLSYVQLFATPGTAACQASLSITNFWNLLKLMTIGSVMSSNHLTLCCQLLLLPSIFPSIRVFSKESVLYIKWPNIGAPASASVLPMNIQDWFPFGWTGWISLHSKGLSTVFSNTTVQKHQFFSTQPPLWSNSHIHTWLLEKP